MVRDDERAVGEHPAGALVAVEMLGIAVKICVAGERDGNRLHCANPRDQFRRDYRAVLNAKTRIAAWPWGMRVAR